MVDRLRARTRRPRPHSAPCLEALEDRVVPAADVVLEWNAIALEAQVLDNALGGPAQQAGPTRASRALAIVQAAVFDAVNSVVPAYTPYLVQVNAPAGASLKAAAAQAAHDTLSALYPSFRPFFDTALADDLSTIPDRPERGGVLVGRTVAAAVLAARANDGSAANMPYTPGTAPGDWQPDPLHPTQKALTPGWGDVTPFVVPSAEKFGAPPPPALTSAAYAAAFKEVKDFGGDGVTTPTKRTPEQTEIGIFWAYDGQPGMGAPPRLYNQIAEMIARQQHNTVVENARLFALINLAMADAGIVSWDTKYDDNFWRPVTAIRAAGTDGNPATVADKTWTPLGAMADNGNGTNFTPPFPAYVSGHATFGSALFRIMADFYGRDDIHFTIGSDEFNGVTKDQNGNVRPVLTRSFDSFSQAAAENAQSRIYLGIHWQFDAVEGLREGKAVADFVFAHALRPLYHGHDGGASPSSTQPPPPQLSSTQGGSGATVSFQGEDSGLILTSPLVSHSDAGGVTPSPASVLHEAPLVSNDPGRLLLAEVLPGGTAKATRRADVSVPDAGSGEHLFGTASPLDLP